uniref:Putative oxidoreductase n=1 Tax=uncultured Gemmatimonadetes bacterium Rifle_16ft_4_minimus_7 TaxID=1665098 RepID=A0A0H4T9U5_9BACT|nr:putative oxidoreductase [uncultured Gemmatimonadetes bacterium Rifle_16ft_4_minimus_7]
MRRVVIDLVSPRPLWSITPEAAAAIRRAFGRGFDVIEVNSATSSDGDGGAGSAEAATAARGAEVYLGYGVPRAVAQAALGTLRWAHSAAAGVRATITPEFLATGAMLTNAKGLHAEPMADWAVTAIGFCLRGFHHAVAAQREARWTKDEFTDGRVPVREFGGARVGLVGLGGIGAAVARRCVALGMEVRAVRRRPRRPRPRGVTWVGGPTQLSELAKRSDVLVIAAPDTGATRGVVNDPVLRALPRGAYVVSMARGSLLDEQALLVHLESGQVAGCVLDVYAKEPLPQDHPFWRHPRVLVSPHVSAVSDRFWERETALLVNNIRRYRRGAKLQNLVDLEAGY